MEFLIHLIGDNSLQIAIMSFSTHANQSAGYKIV